MADKGCSEQKHYISYAALDRCWKETVHVQHILAQFFKEFSERFQGELFYMYKHTYIYWCSVFKAGFLNILDVKKRPAELKKKCIKKSAKD